MINSNLGDWILISNNVYSTVISRFKYNFTEYEGYVSFPLENVDVGKLSTEWQDINKVRYQPLRFDNIQSTDGQYILVIISIMILYIISFYLLYTKYKSGCYPKSKYSYPDINDLKELH